MALDRRRSSRRLDDYDDDGAAAGPGYCSSSGDESRSSAANSTPKLGRTSKAVLIEMSNNVKKLKCSLCSLEFFSTVHHKAHLRMHAHSRSGQALSSGGTTRASVKCDLEGCSRVFASAERLLEHAEEEHALQCSECDRHFAAGQNLELGKHYKEEHAKAPMAVKGRRASTGTPTSLYKETLQNSHSRSSSPSVNAQRATNKRSQSPYSQVPTKQPRLFVSSTRIPLPGPCIFCPERPHMSCQPEFDFHVWNCHPFECPFCSHRKMFKDIKSLRKHFCISHNNHEAHFCRHCTKVFLSESDLTRHQCARTGRPPEIGSKPPYNPSADINRLNVPPLNLLRHWEIYHPAPSESIVEVLAVIPAIESVKELIVKPQQNQGPYRCKLCPDKGIVYLQEKQLLQHMLVTHPIKCPECDRKYNNVDAIRKHTRRTHGLQHLYLCRWCSLAFTDQSEHIEHSASVHGTRMPNLPYSDPMDKSYLLSGDPPISDESGFRCTRCPRSYLNDEGLRGHGRKAHGINLVFCKPCLMSFESPDMKQEHLENCPNAATKEEHVGSSPYATRASALHDSPAKSDLQSSKSQAAVSASYSAPANIVTYGDDLPVESSFGCTRCSKRYYKADSIRSHAKRDHKLTISSCKVCFLTFENTQEKVKHLESEEHRKRDPNASSVSFTGSQEQTVFANSSMPKDSVDDKQEQSNSDNISSSEVNTVLDKTAEAEDKSEEPREASKVEMNNEDTPVQEDNVRQEAREEAAAEQGQSQKEVTASGKSEKDLKASGDEDFNGFLDEEIAIAQEKHDAFEILVQELEAFVWAEGKYTFLQEEEETHEISNNTQKEN